jgi:hemerythrin
MSLNWKNEYSVGNTQIDLQHQKLFELINQLEASTHASEFSQIAPLILKELEEYALIHFESEEEHMKTIGYPDLEQHKKIHLSLKNDLMEEINMHMEAGLTTLKLIHLYQFLKRWIEQHILEEDKKYSTLHWRK